ncbi:hypothetical protein C456_03336 [Haloferax volcanii DSM 14919]|uniref:Uncharacterized protein n=1 Tax=Haloferax lucentense (strain DSM 14919 / JCM 9276 / NCIMB 13854 / Aa 2.2) TaxID=1230452 RepID=M0GYQ4_HALL2|nr:hypothetical protein C456_03336 [Haloferax lucentense DSM 14919]
MIFNLYFSRRYIIKLWDLIPTVALKDTINGDLGIFAKHLVLMEITAFDLSFREYHGEFWRISI